MDRTELVTLVRILGILILIAAIVIIADLLTQQVAFLEKYRSLISTLVVIAFYLDLVLNKRYEGITEWFFKIDSTD